MEKAPRYLPRWERIRQIERHTLDRTPRDVRAAQRTFRQALTLTDQLRLAGEVAETRGAELCRAYRNVIDVTFGMKERRDRRSGKAQLLRTPCIIFVVKHKWQDNEQGQLDQKLPEHLFAYWSVNGARKLCAIPTDVEDATRRVRIRPQSGSGKIVVELDDLSAKGVVTCAIYRSTFPDIVYAVSCRHVFSISSRTHPDDITRAIVKVVDEGNVIARTTPVKGHLRDSPAFSLDAQLARVMDPDALRELLGGITLGGFLQSPDEMPSEYWLIPPNGDPIRAQFRGFVHTPIDYGATGIHKVVHPRLIESRLGRPTFEGDSGSPLVSGHNGGLLLGIHIAGNEQDTSWAIPAWQFLFPDDYSGATSTEKWTLFEM